jgi:hypothetical protein
MFRRSPLFPVLCAAGLIFFLLATGWVSGHAQVAASGPQSAGPSTPPTALRPQQNGLQSLAAPKVKPEPKKAKEAYKRGLRAERDGDWQEAQEDYGDAAAWDPSEREYLLRRDLARSHLVQTKVDLAERDAVSGRLKDARKELVDAIYLDPSNRFVRDRLTELNALAPDDPNAAQSAPKQVELAGPAQLDYTSGTRNFNYRGDTQGAYDEVARQFGVEVAFDEDLRSSPVRLQVNDVDFPTVMRILGDEAGTFWRPLARHLFFVAQDTPQKRKDYAESVVRTVALPASESPEQMTETLRVVRDITGITRATLDTNARTITLRAAPQAVAVASGLIDDLQKPNAEVILEIEILDVDRNYARQLGITPPQSSQIFALNSQEIQEAQQSVQGLVDVITQVFGQPSSLSGLSGSQITSLLNSGQLSLNSLVPPVAAFGGGESTFLATMPGAAANFSRMLSLVQHGRRVLLRAQDGQPASFFVGDRVPVELSNFSASLSGTGTSITGLSSTNFPTTNYATGNTPNFVTTASLRGNSNNDLIVSNFTDNTISVLLGNGDGTFGTQTTFPTGIGPVSIATGTFRAASGIENIDLAVANQTANTISILLGEGDGTFLPGTTLQTGHAPISVVAKNLHDLNGQGNLDLIVANQNDNTIYIYQGNGDGTFKAPTVLQLPGGFAPSNIAAVDFNGDGHLDLAITDEGSASVSVFLGRGDGTFGPRTDYATGNAPVWVSTGDFNGDGALDLAVANKNDNTVSILFGNVNTAQSGVTSVGNGTFTFGAIYPAGTTPTSIAVADYNIDGLPDLAVAAEGDNAVSVLLNLGGGTFGPHFELPVQTSPVSIVTADFNGDGRQDVATANSGSNSVSVILNSSNFTAPNSSSSPFSGGVGFPGVQYIDIGLKVKATPRIHQDGQVTLQLDFDISSLSGASFNTIPVIANDTVTQTVRVKQNETAVLAGLLQHQLTNMVNGTPGIANIPEIGLFASDQNNQNEDTELLILITPRVVRSAPRHDHVMYAGQGAIEGATVGTINEAPVAPGAPRPQVPSPGVPAAEQPAGVPQPTTQVGTPVAPAPVAPQPEQPQPAPAQPNPPEPAPQPPAQPGPAPQPPQTQPEGQPQQQQQPQQPPQRPQ